MTGAPAMTVPAPPRPFPRFALVGAGLLIAATIIAAAVARYVGTDTFVPTAAVVVSRDLLFQDRADGSIAIVDAADGAPVEVVAPGTNGFLRAMLRGLARDRRREDAGRALPFRLTFYADGRLTLEDPFSGRRIDLEAFGHTNEQVFARLLPPRSATP